MAISEYQDLLRVRIPTELRDQLNRVAADNRTTVSKWVRHKLKAAVEVEGQKDKEVKDVKQLSRD